MKRLYAKAEKLVRLLEQRNETVSSAESCTGGMISSAITSVSGSSSVFEFGCCTYSERIKTLVVGVDPSVIAEKGVVSTEVASAMAEGARRKASASYGVATTGIAGPTGGGVLPVGTVCIAVSSGEKTVSETCHFDGDREKVRVGASEKAIEMLINFINKQQKRESL